MYKLYHSRSHFQYRVINAAFICENLAGYRCGNEYLAHCPVHKDSKPSLSLRDLPDGRVLVHCFGGCSQDEVIGALASMGLWPGYSARNPVAVPISKLDKRKYDVLQRVWSHSSPITSGDPVDRYLRERRIVLKKYPKALRFHPNLGFWEYDKIKNKPVCIGHFPTMIARIEGPSRDLVSIHRTYLSSDGYGKAPVPNPKKLMSPERPGATKGAAIRLFGAEDVIAVAEGIETALAVHICTGLPSWATISAGGMESVLIPDSIRSVMICADRDESERGERAAKKLARRLFSEGRKCKILIPNVIGTDWADPLEVHRD
jgi:putative DNA primase/helicase